MILSSLHANDDSWSKNLVWNCTAVTNKNAVMYFATAPTYNTPFFLPWVSFSFTGNPASPYRALFRYARFKEQKDDREECLVRVWIKNEPGNLSSAFQSKSRVSKKKPKQTNQTKPPIFFFLIRKERMSWVPKKKKGVFSHEGFFLQECENCTDQYLRQLII